MRVVASIALLTALSPCIAGCNDDKGLLLAKQVQDRGDVGDYLLQNDRIRVNILGGGGVASGGNGGGSQ